VPLSPGNLFFCEDLATDITDITEADTDRELAATGRGLGRLCPV
jgi:hypothetical protein